MMKDTGGTFQIQGKGDMMSIIGDNVQSIRYMNGISNLVERIKIKNVKAASLLYHVKSGKTLITNYGT